LTVSFCSLIGRFGLPSSAGVLPFAATLSTTFRPRLTVPKIV
jgi:hypothetical protein